MNIDILVIGSGGREHALCWRLKQSPSVNRLFCAPGNGGIGAVAQCVSLASHDAIRDFALREKIGLVVIGPEQPLVEGLADFLEASNIPVFGPSKKAAQLEGSKSFTKALCAKYNIPTAAYGHFHDATSAKAYLTGKNLPIVIKADGLAAGKGVIIAQTSGEATTAIENIFSGQFGAAGSSVVIEEFMEGEEASFFALSDGEHALEFASAQDHKRAFDGDLGPNTGGMGAYSPAPVMTPQMRQRVMREIILPTVAAMKTEAMPYRGVLFAGLMITSDGPKLIEYNARFGDPETQVMMARLASDLVPALLACSQGGLDNIQLEFSEDAAVCVVMAAQGYPGDYQKGSEIKNLEAASQEAIIFHAGTKKDGHKILATGGRVLGVTATGTTVQQAQKRAYEAVDQIDWPEGFCRRDIAWRALR